MARKGGKQKSEFTVASVFILAIFVALLIFQSDSMESIAYGAKNKSLAFSYKPVNELLEKVTGDYFYSDDFSSQEKREISIEVKKEIIEIENRLEILKTQKEVLIGNIKEDIYRLKSIAESNDVNLLYKESEFDEKIYDAEQQLNNITAQKESKVKECDAYTGSEKSDCYEELIRIRENENISKTDLRTLKYEKKMIWKELESNKAERYVLELGIEKNKNRLKEVEEEIASVELYLLEYIRVEKQVTN